MDERQLSRAGAEAAAGEDNELNDGVQLSQTLFQRRTESILKS